MIKKNEYKNNARKKIRKTKKYRKRFLKLFLKRFFIVVVCLASLSIPIFGINFLLSKVLCVKIVQVESDAPYSNSELIQSGGIKTGDGLIFLNSKVIEEKIYCSFPYVDGVNVIKQFPDKVKIIVKAATPAYTIGVNGEYFVVSFHNKLLEKRCESLPELVNIVGADISVNEYGNIEYKNENTKDLCVEIIESFKGKDLNNIKEINLMDTENIQVNYDNRINILLGNGEDIDYKVLTAKEIIINKIGASEKGNLDVKDVKKENRSYFSPY